MVQTKKTGDKLRDVALFGAAMSSLFVVPEINADIVNITWNGGNVSYYFSINGSTQAIPMDIDQVGMGTATFSTDLCVFYTVFTNSASSSTLFNAAIEIGNDLITGIGKVKAGELLNPATFQGQTGKLDLSGVGYAAFKTSLGNVGWFKIRFQPPFSGLTFQRGEFGDAGETLLVGELKGDLNCDGAVNLLDIQPFVDLLSTGGYSTKGDFDDNGSLDLLDVEPFVDALTGN